MKLLQFKQGEEIRLGIKVENNIIDVKETASSLSIHVPVTMEEVIKQGMPALEKLNALLKLAKKTRSESDLTYAPVVHNPEKIICVGLNYKNHVTETQMDLPTFPVLFSKFNNALAAHQQMISLPDTDKKFDYEGELVVVIGKETSNVSEEEALSHVFGYTCGNDLSARGLQFRNSQWLLGKSLDYFAPIGPYLVTGDELDPNNLKIECRVNGEVRQSSNTCKMIFNCSYIVSYISKYITLKPGDIIFTGTPDGVILGSSENQQKWLKQGDRVEVEIEGIGILMNVLQ